MSRDTAAVRHRRRPHPAGNNVAQEDDIRVLWRRLPETCPRSYEANFFQRTTAATRSVAWACTSDAQLLVAGGVKCWCCELVGSALASLSRAAFVR